MLGSLKPLVLAVAVAAFAPAVAGAQQPAKATDEQRCTGQAGVTADAQAAACTALIDSKRFSKQNLAILHSNRGIAHGKAGDYDRALADFDTALRINPNHVRAYVNRGNASTPSATMIAPSRISARRSGWSLRSSRI